MKTTISLIAFFFISIITLAQSTVSGIVTDAKNNPIEGANIYLEGTYDGASSDVNGKFNFETSEKGTQNLVVSMIAFDTYMQAGDVSYLKDLNIELQEAINQLTGVTLTAGSFQAGDNSKVSVLKPLDIVTTAGAAGDFV